MPNDANPFGSLFGGTVMALVDLAASIAAHGHASCPVVTASVDHMNFLYPVKIGKLVTCYSQVNRVYRTSMEVGLRVMVENMSAGERVPLSPVVKETDDERRRYDEAILRRESRLDLRKRSLESRK